MWPCPLKSRPGKRRFCLTVVLVAASPEGLKAPRLLAHIHDGPVVGQHDEALVHVVERSANYLQILLYPAVARLTHITMDAVYLRDKVPL